MKKLIINKKLYYIFIYKHISDKYKGYTAVGVASFYAIIYRLPP